MTLPVFFSPQMATTTRSYSPSANKPAQVVDHWKAIALDIEVHEPSPASIQDLLRAHDEEFVRGVLSCKIDNGFGNRSPHVARSLPWTSGAMLSAARHALATGSIACAPCSGFHHAGYAESDGFCTFNGLMVAACALLADGASRIGVIDCDMHYGNGTVDIIEHLGLQKQVLHFTAGARYTRPSRAREFMADLPEFVRSMRECDVVLYQAGADQHVEDPLGGLLDDEQLLERDRIVFRVTRELGLPLAWNLAGGYRRDGSGTIAPVLATHTATARESNSALGTVARKDRPEAAG